MNSPMKKTSLSNIIAPLVALSGFSLGLVLSSGGCAATPTKESTGEYVDDSAITLRVKAAFVNDPVVKALSVNVETFKGIVQLSGFVNTSAEKAQAGRIAAGIKGVTDVKNNITVK
ncbi:MAG: BON domain-containing protein [Opitutaceae bacterium]|nr:BON domain-containing protein [Opitutaceae bacterium]